MFHSLYYFFLFSSIHFPVPYTTFKNGKVRQEESWRFDHARHSTCSFKSTVIINMVVSISKVFNLLICLRCSDSHQEVIQAVAEGVDGWMDGTQCGCAVSV